MAVQRLRLRATGASGEQTGGQPGLAVALSIRRGLLTGTVVTVSRKRAAVRSRASAAARGCRPRPPPSVRSGPVRVIRRSHPYRMRESSAVPPHTAANPHGLSASGTPPAFMPQSAPAAAAGAGSTMTAASALSREPLFCIDAAPLSAVSASIASACRSMSARIRLSRRCSRR